MKLIARKLLETLRRHWLLTLCAVFVAGFGLALCAFVLWPQYRNPQTRMYTSGLGYASVQRKLGKAFPVDAAAAKQQRVSIPYLGEGIVSGDPVRVSLIPMAMVQEVLVDTGDKVESGQVLLRLDQGEATRKVASAKLAFQTAEAEFQRVKVGSAYVLAQERPQHDKIKLDSARESVALLEEKLASYEKSLQRGLIAETELLPLRQQLGEARNQVIEWEFFSSISEVGAEHSLTIAENAVEDARQALAYEESQLKNFTVRAPVDGIVSEVLIRAGEFNQDFGKPAFVLTTGLWFDGYFDQTALADLKNGMPAEVVLEAYPGRRWTASVDRIVSEVSFASGGPEVGRPLRPRGTGAPEWAATFRVRLKFDEAPDLLVHGMTGNVRVIAKRDSIVIPRNAPLSIAAGRGLVLVPATSDKTSPQGDDSSAWLVQGVELGVAQDGWQEVRGGLAPGAFVFASGHRILQEGDRVDITEIDWEP